LSKEGQCLRVITLLSFLHLDSLIHCTFVEGFEVLGLALGFV
jgi:hypothetical protein